MTLSNFTRVFATITLTLLATAGLVSAQDTKAGDLVISQPWSRATPSGAKVAGGYLTIENKGASADRLVSGTTDAAARVEIHEMSMANGVMTMRPLDQGVAIEPGKSIKFAPGGYHLMFFDPTKPLKQGETFPVTLTFEKAGQVKVDFAVQAVGAQAPGGAAGASGHEDHDHSKMSK